MVFVHPDIWGGVWEDSCCKDSTSVPRTEAGTVRRCGPGHLTFALVASTKARDTEPQAARTPLATVTPSSSSSVKHADPQARDRDRVVVGQLLAGRGRCSRIEGNAGSPKPADWYIPAPSGVALRSTTSTLVSVSNQVSSAFRHARP